jgi:hypothetical protein
MLAVAVVSTGVILASFYHLHRHVESTGKGSGQLLNYYTSE